MPKPVIKLIGYYHLTEVSDMLLLPDIRHLPAFASKHESHTNFPSSYNFHFYFAAISLEVISVIRDEHAALVANCFFFCNFLEMDGNSVAPQGQQSGSFRVKEEGG